ncbi:MAG: response regulator [Pseudomonadales bacterium]|nr:response regulator [Pseudomonadales bacterium]
MTEQHHIIALDWVKGEIEETLKQARQALESYVENSADPTRLRFCLAYLHQVHGTLQMVELYGAALLAEEMEAVCLSLLNGQVTRTDEAQEVLMRAMLQVPAYLDHIRSSRRDLPMILMPLLNDLRSARNEPLLTESALFKPDLSAVSRLDNSTLLTGSEQKQILKRLRHAYQMSLVELLHQSPDSRHLKNMQRVFDRLSALSEGSSLKELWDVVGALVEVLQVKGVDVGSTIKALLGQTDRQIKRFTEQGGFVPPQDLLRNILYYIAKAEAGSPRIDAVKTRFKLGEALPADALIDEDRARLHGPDRDAVRSVVDALCEEISRVKDNLDIFVRSVDKNLTELDALSPTLKQVADTIGVLGLGQQRRIILEQIGAMEDMVSKGHIDDGRLMDVAGSLLYVEASLHGLAHERSGAISVLEDVLSLPNSDLSEAQEAVLRESRSALEQAKDAVIGYISSQWNVSYIEGLPEIFNGVRGGLEILSLHRPAGLLGMLAHYVDERLLRDAPRPDWAEMDTLADAISGVEYYLEHLAHGNGENAGPLDMAERALARLHFTHFVESDEEVPDQEGDATADTANDMSVGDDLGENIDGHTLQPEGIHDETQAEVELADLSADSEVMPGTQDADILAEAPLVPDDIQNEAILEAVHVQGDTSELQPWHATHDETQAEVELADLSADSEVMPGTQDADILAEAPLVPDDIQNEAMTELQPRQATHDEAQAEVELADLLADSEVMPGTQDADILAEAPLVPDAIQNEAMPEAVHVQGDTPELKHWQVAQDEHGTDAGTDAEFSHNIKEEANSWIDEQNKATELDVAQEAESPTHSTATELSMPLEPLETGDDQRSKDAIPAPAALVTHGLISKPVVPILHEMPEDDFNGDDEIREIFVEEAEEVLDAIGEYFPQWAAQFDDIESLKEFRRGFHTLKGSGRMVGAKVIGELAWSVENMLNRVMDKSLQPHAAMVNLISEVVSAIPGLVEDFKSKQSPRQNTGPLMQAAAALARGEKITSLDIAVAAEPEEQDTADHLGSTDATVLVFDALADSLSPVNMTQDDTSHFIVDDQNDEPGIESLKGELEREPDDSMQQTADEQIDDFALEPAASDLLSEAGNADHDVALGHEERALEQQDTDELAANAELEAELVAYGSEQGAGPMDPLLLEIFVAEAQAHLADLQDYLEGPVSHEDVTDALLRALHTLKGSAAMANVAAIAEISAPLEALFRNLRNNGRAVRVEHRALLLDSISLIEQGVKDLDQGEVPVNPDSMLLDRIHALIKDAMEVEEGDEDSVTAEELEAGPVATLLAASIDQVLDAPDDLLTWLKAEDLHPLYVEMSDQLGRMNEVATRLGLGPMARLAQALALVYDRLNSDQLTMTGQLGQQLLEGHDAIINLLDALAANLELVYPEVLLATLDDLGMVSASDDEGLLDLFLEECDELLVAADALRPAIFEHNDHNAWIDLQRYIHTLRGSARLAGLVPLGDAAEALDQVLEMFLAKRLESTHQLASLIDHALLQLMQMAKELRVHGQCYPQPELIAHLRALTEVRPVMAKVDAISQRSKPEVAQPVYDSELLDIFLEEADEILDASSRDLHAWLQDPKNSVYVQQLQRGLHTLKGGARMAEIAEIGDLAHEMETLFERMAGGQLEFREELTDLLNQCQYRLVDAVTALRAQKPCPDTRVLIEVIQRYLADPDHFEVLPQTVTLSPVPVSPVSGSEGLDPEVLGFFLEESEELSAGIESCLTALLDAHDDMSAISLLLRHLHTLKGGARLAELVDIGDFAHAWESELLAVQEGRVVNDDDFWMQQLERQSTLQSMLAKFRQGGSSYQENFSTPDTLLDSHAKSRLEIQAQQQDPLTTGVDKDTAVSSPKPDLLIKPASLGQVAPPPMRIHQLTDAQRAPQEMVRVPADLLEKLVNLAGETSIARGRVEQGVLGFQQSVEDMGSTVVRLAEQLRRMDIELESQIRARHSHELDSKYEDFDPLEMDQYSSLNQLSKALSESASDLVDIKSTLIDKARDAETLLLQQSRINTELQEGLMRTRMVTFSRLVPRLRRIVRQTGQEVGKLVDLEVVNPEGEMDRTLMERIVAPLEHMMRNAVDHGIESRDRRLAAEKPEEGKVTLVLSREGGEVVLKLSDDGAGIDIAAVRAKAHERGLLADAEMSDNDVMQFIFHAGFSTAQTVTQISGRGVGMDVVQSEIKQMGGTVEISSVPGRGTTFIVRLPFTVSVNRALMVRIGEDMYAVPLQQVEGIVRANPSELENYYAPGAPLFEYAGASYQLHYLGEFVHGHRMPNLVSQVLPLPVLLVRGGDQRRIAVQVDALLGSREVVVKSVGAQLASVAGISGATILGDGSVVIILDLQALLRASVLTLGISTRRAVPELAPAQIQPEGEVGSHHTQLVMVVDDSVTMRKVMSRLLERHGYEVVLAKDGLDAINRLEDVSPDIMLLDIEMPRMDGFEVASLVRHNARLEKLPIIMITSRTGEKHRERAYSIGVDAYLGKPFAEQNLLDTVRELLEARAER